MPELSPARLDVLNPVAQLEAELRGQEPLPARRERYQGVDLMDSWDAFNQDYLERGIGDGLPLVPPTRPRVEAALRALRLSPGHVLGRLAPFYGAATVEKVAINAVMAGCKPEHLPVVIAALEAILETPEEVFPVRAVTMSTNPTALMVVVNGPVTAQLGINSGRCTLGPGKQSAVNTVIGRALRLVLMNVGHCYPGSGDMDTIGSPAKYSMCLAENEAQSPWVPLQVERGFSPGASTVTVFGANSIVHYNNYQADAEKILLGWAGVASASGGPSNFIPSRGEARFGSCQVMLLAPDHARILNQAGHTKESIRRYLLEHAGRPLKRVLATLGVGWEALPAGLQERISAMDPEETVPEFSDPEQIQIVVVGGSNGQSDLVPCMGMPTITREIVHAV